MHTIPPHTLYVTSNRSLCSDVNRFVNRVGLALLLQVAEEGDHFSAGSPGSDNRRKVPPSLQIRCAKSVTEHDTFDSGPRAAHFWWMVVNVFRERSPKI